MPDKMTRTCSNDRCDKQVTFEWEVAGTDAKPIAWPLGNTERYYGPRAGKGHSALAVQCECDTLNLNVIAGHTIVEAP